MTTKYVITKCERRLMTPEEVSAKCEALKLDPRVKEYILNEFEDASAVLDDDDDDIIALDDDCHVIGTRGRIAYGMSWESTFEELGDVMGVENANFTDDERVQKRVRKVFNVFFQE